MLEESCFALCSFAKTNTDWTQNEQNATVEGTEKARDGSDPKECFSEGLNGVVMMPGWTNCNAKGTCFNVAHGNIVVVTWRDQRVGSAGTELPLMGEEKWSSARATLMSSAGIQNKTGCTNGTFLNCVIQVEYTSNMLKKFKEEWL